MNTLRNQLIYQVSVRNYSKEGTFTKLTKDLDRIKDLGTDILYLMPVQPIGVKGRKGEYGSPYAIQNYTGISKDLGTLDDFKKLIDTSHKKGLKVMLDIVFHHTSPDNVWVTEHPEFYHYRDGKLSNKVGDWDDIVDFEFNNNPKLIEALTDVLLFWVELGMDGFRFDVASLLPHEFYQHAFKKVREANPNIIMLAESVHFSFLEYMRFHGYTALSDAELYQYFDVLYDYDAHMDFVGYLKNEKPLEDFRQMMRLQERIYPKNYVKARNVENHDNPRIRYYTQSDEKTLQWLGYVFFSKGIAFLHYGFETGTDHLNYLFEKDPVDFKKIKPEWVKMIKHLATLKKDPIFAQDTGYKIVSHKQDVLHFEYHNDKEIRVGIFNVGAQRGMLTVDLPEGTYVDYLAQQNFEIRFGTIPLMDHPLIFSIHKDIIQKSNH